MRARAQARGVEGPDPNVLDPEAVPRDGVDLPSKFPAADHALVREHQGPIGPVGKCHVFVRCALAAAAAAPTLTPEWSKAINNSHIGIYHNRYKGTQRRDAANLHRITSSVDQCEVPGLAPVRARLGRVGGVEEPAVHGEDVHDRVRGHQATLDALPAHVLDAAQVVSLEDERLGLRRVQQALLALREDAPLDVMNVIGRGAHAVHRHELSARMDPAE
mmetsp:Transcript_9094/g.26542  ORF Transcript_9094/g.26542 Transcript_9094/m.26542 type:complete len:218 (-) Transcript_9094:221-874(-)